MLFTLLIIASASVFFSNSLLDTGIALEGFEAFTTEAGGCQIARNFLKVVRQSRYTSFRYRHDVARRRFGIVCIGSSIADRLDGSAISCRCRAQGIGHSIERELLKARQFPPLSFSLAPIPLAASMPYSKHMNSAGAWVVMIAKVRQCKTMRITRRGRMDTQHRRDWRHWILAGLLSFRLFCRSHCVADRPEPDASVQ